jgi:cytochrome c peroxidase
MKSTFIFSRVIQPAIFYTALCALPALAQNSSPKWADAQTGLETLGRRIYFDTSLSTPPGQSCASCHLPATGFDDPDRGLAVSRGAIKSRTGFRNAPTAAYAKFIPPLSYDAEGGTYVGGLFLDGRVNSLEEQAQFPFLNPLEMHNPDPQAVVAKLRKAPYAPLFRRIFGTDSLDPENSEAAYLQAAGAIAAFEKTPLFSPFTSKFDDYLKGKAKLTARELRGLALFNGKANCFACHPSEAMADQPGPMFTDFTYDNIGIPKNWDIPFLYLPPELNPDGTNFVDFGLAVTVAQFDPEHAADEAGKFRVSTLRNLKRTGPYGHNGYFKTLKEVVHFYNTRDVPEAGWPQAEVPETVNHDELGDLGLTDREEDDIVAFLKTLTDSRAAR